MTTVEELIAEARTWVGVPWCHQGRSKLGVDCAGFLEQLGVFIGLPPGYTAPRNYGRRPNGQLEVVVSTYCTRYPAGHAPGSVRPGSLVLMKWPRDDEPGHVAFCTGPTLIHAYARVGKVVEHGYRGVWLKYTHSAWLMPGVAYG